MKTILHHSVGFVIYTTINGFREYLLLKYPEGHLDLVKGHIDDTDENLLATASRELEEETGISEFKHIAGFEKTINYTYKREGALHKKRVDFFLAEVFTKEIKISHEHTQFMWLNFDDSKNQITFENARSLVLAVEDLLS